MVRLEQYYRETVVPRLSEDLKIENAMQVPRITKITINMGVGEAVADKKVMDAAVADLTKITGQKPLDHQVAQGDRVVQDPRGSADRCAR